MINKLIVNFNEIDKNDVGVVGGKGANLGEMVKANFPVPNGFIITANTYFRFIRENKLDNKIKKILDGTNVDSPKELENASVSVKKLILSITVPEYLAKEIARYYSRLSNPFNNSLVAIRSSATAEDLPTASFAGQQETYLNISGESNVILKVRDCWASLFEPRAIFYRAKNNFDHFRVGIAVVVQRMVQSEVSGIMFTMDPVTNDKNKILVECILGLGELIVQGAVTPDHYELSKSNFAIVNKIIGVQDKMMVKIGAKNVIKKLSPAIGKRAKLSEKIITDVAKIGSRIEKHYYFPQDIEWAYENGKIFIVQSRPITTFKIIEKEQQEAKNNASVFDAMKLVLSGQPASPGIAAGPAKVIFSAKELEKIKQGDILVTTMTNPDFVPAMKRACAVVTNEGGRTAHAAIVSRELGIPAIVGTKTATRTIKNNSIYTVDGAKGNVYSGGIIINRNTAPVRNESTISRTGSLIKTATKVYVNLAEPENAKAIAKRNVDGVGLLRAEFMIAQIGKHPKSFIHENKQQEYINKLVHGMKQFTDAFNPRPVIYRATDFKTNEYKDLKGGEQYEPKESNPMLGYRGAYRYIHDPEVFRMEIEAIKIVRNKYGFKNLWLMIPFVRTVKELIDVKSLLSVNGLYRSSNFKLLMMVEIPSNVILLDKFIDAGIDGVSIGSNDLTMLILGTDRDNSEVAPEFDERNEAVLWALEKIIKTCIKRNITASICGQAPSDYPELTEKLVKWGITSVSVNPDCIENTRSIVAACEKGLFINDTHKK